MSIFSCFDDVIGITRKADVCPDPDVAAYSSDSGLYIDELPGMSLRILNSTGGNFTLLEKMENARENAINAFKVDVLREILKTKEPSRTKFVGNVGGKSFTSLLSADSYHGLRMYSDITGGTFTLRAITLMLSDSAGATLYIYTGTEDEDGATPIHTIALSSLAGRAKLNTITPIQLDLEGDLYFVYISTSGTGRPYNNQLTCNCGGFKWCFNIEQPCYKYSRDKWTEWAMVAGIHGDDLSIRDDWGTSREARGLVLHGDFGCDTLGILCSDHSDWSGNMVDAAIAWAIVYKAGSFLTSYILDSEEINRYTLLGIDGLSANIQFYELKYKEMLEFIAENIEEDRNECLRCKSPHGYKRMTQML